MTTETQTTTLKISARERTERIRLLKSAMAKRDIDLFLVTGKTNFEYFGGYGTFVSMTSARPMALLVPREGEKAFYLVSRLEELPIKMTQGVPAEIDIVTYHGMLPEFIDLVVTKLKEHRPKRIAIDYGEEQFGIGSLKLIDDIRAQVSGCELVEAADAIWNVRMVKSPIEIAQKRAACKIATDAIKAAFKEVRIGMTEQELYRLICSKAYQLGADDMRFLAVKFGREDIPTHLPARDLPLALDDFIYVDIGVVKDGSVTDLARIAKAGKVTEAEQEIYRSVRKLTQDILHAYRPGMTTAEAYAVYIDACAKSPLGVPEALLKLTARVGHGSGYDATEPPSVSSNGADILREGMILHSEPLYKINGGFYITEELAVITASGTEILTDVADEAFPEVGL